MAKERELDDANRRLTTPEAERWIGRKIPCLDHGFIYLVDYMGGDASIVQAARVSYGLGTKSVSEDRGLIRYLMRHQHTTPFEMVELKFHVKLPIFVARQWIRHRTACVTGDAGLIFDLPGAERRGRRQYYRVTIENLHRLWHEGTTHPIRKRKPPYLERVDPATDYTVPELSRLVDRREEDVRNRIRSGALEARTIAPISPKHPCLFVRGSAWHAYATRSYLARVPMRDRLRRMRLRMCDESTGEIRHTQVMDVWQSGVRPVYRVTLENGYHLTMTKDHRCLTERGWMTLGEATGLRQRDDGGVTWEGTAPALAVNGVVPHRDPGWLSEQRRRGLDVSAIAQNAGVSYHTVRKYLARYGLQFELALLAAVENQEPLRHFWERHSPGPRPERKRKPPVRRLVRTFVKIARIEFAGHQMTYDMEVSGPYHNYVANGFIVHNSVNEYSGRYSIMPDEFYLPAPENVTLQSKANRQGGGESVDRERTAEVLALLEREQRLMREGYEKMLAWDLRRELARINLGVAQYTEWYWKSDLHNIVHFLQLRLDPHAQHEIRVYGEAMAQIVRAVAPVAWEAFEDYQLQAERFSRLELEALARLVGGETGKWPSDQQVIKALPDPWRETGPGRSLKRNRERDEFLAKLKRLASHRRSRV